MVITDTFLVDAEPGRGVQQIGTGRDYDDP